MSIIREERIGGQRLILGDCLAVMPTLGRFDAVVTDPPYGINRSGQHQTRRGGTGRDWKKAYKDKGWDTAAPDAEFLNLMLSLSDKQVLWGGNHFCDGLPISRGWLVWFKGQTGLTMSDAELAWTSLDMVLRVMNMHRCAMWGDGSVHPTQKPVALMEWCLGFLPNAATILDPFMGSGTTLVACQKLGRAGTGIEIDPEYFDIACRRVDEAARQPDLLIDAPAPTVKPHQEALI